MFDQSNSVVQFVAMTLCTEDFAARAKSAITTITKIQDDLQRLGVHDDNIARAIQNLNTFRKRATAHAATLQQDINLR